MSEGPFDRPLLAPWYRLVGDGDRLLLEHGQAVVVLEGAAVRRFLPALLPLLDGTRTIGDLAVLLGDASRPAIEQAIDVLGAHGVLSEGAPADEGTRAAAHLLAAARGLAPSLVGERLAGCNVGIAGRSASSVEIARLLRLAGVGDVRRVSWRGDSEVGFVITAPAPDEAAALPEWNARALERGTVWLPVRPFDGHHAAVGPLIVPRESGCYACLLLRREANLEYGAVLEEIERIPIAATADSGVEAITAGIAAHLALRWIGGNDTTLPGVLHALELFPRLTLTEHHVLRVPRCPACSPVASVASPLPWHGVAAA
ncbi:MAG: TOMM precursor leader peptide-binding protein [Actinomycetes bacterium]